MHPKTRLSLALGLLVTALAPAVAADGGYWSGNKGARAAGRGGAFCVRADDLMAVAYNPAGLARLSGSALQVGNRFSYNAYSFERQPTLDWGQPGNVPPYREFAPVENDEPWQLLEPLLGFRSNFGLEGWGFALAAYAPPGISRQAYPIDGGQRYMMVSRRAEIIDYSASAAWSYLDRFGVGASAQWVYLRKLDYQLVIDGNPYLGVANPVEADFDILSTVSVSDPFTFNAILGAWYRPLPFLEFAISGQVVPATWKAHGTLSADALSIDQDIQLSRGGLPANDVTLQLPLPLTARGGARYIHSTGGRELFDVEMDLVYETWSRVDRFTLDSNHLQATLMDEDIEIGVIEIEKQWQDTLGVHLGGDFAWLPDLLSVRGGLYYETPVAKPAYAHVDFPSGSQLGAALGGSVWLSNVELSLAYEYRHQLEQSVTEGEGRVYQQVPGSLCQAPYTDADACHPAYLGQPAPTVNGGRYRAHSHILALDARYRF